LVELDVLKGKNLKLKFPLRQFYYYGLYFQRLIMLFLGLYLTP